MPPEWRCSAFSRAASSHPDDCQDSAIARFRDDGTVLLCVADGASSSRCASEASSFVTRSAELLFAEWDWPGHDHQKMGDSCSRYMDAIGQAYDQWISSGERDTADFHTTVSVAVVTHDWILLAAVGDGFAAVQFESPQKVVVPMPPDRPGAGGGAYMVADWRSQMRSVALFAPAANAVFLSTDGLERLLRFPRIEQPDGSRKPCLVGVQPQLSEVISDYSIAGTELGSSALAHANFSQKVDDVGVAIAAR